MNEVFEKLSDVFEELRSEAGEREYSIQTEEGKIKGFVFEQGAEDMTGLPEGISGFDSIAEAVEV